MLLDDELLLDDGSDGVPFDDDGDGVHELLLDDGGDGVPLDGELLLDDGGDGDKYIVATNNSNTDLQ